ncbi:MAG: hypothetical protein DHS20C05_19110 [Hyphococcus sp.]|nr:MAG: hypothetical protein DHS20C05_19110 [Marinicaulis sp.]
MVNDWETILVRSFGLLKRGRLRDDAARSRASIWGSRTALALIIIYNLVGLADIYSTTMAIESGAGTEANPVVRLAMEHAGDAWIVGKLALQLVISIMVLWFPHWFVLTMFGVATTGNAWIVYNNFLIAGYF